MLASTESMSVNQSFPLGPRTFCSNSYPGICSQYACDECFNMVITECSQCSQVAIVIRRVARIWKRGGGYFERVRSLQTTLTGIFIDLEAVSDGLSEN